jgi:hypothetical protein
MLCFAETDGNAWKWEENSSSFFVQFDEEVNSTQRFVQFDEEV